MQYFLTLSQEKNYGQIPVADETGHICFIIRGNLENPNHTLYLYDFNNQEIGRLFRDGVGIIASFTIDVVRHSLVKVRKMNSPAANVFYISGLNYLVTGSIKKGTYKFRLGFKTVASVNTEVRSSGVTLCCEISKPEDVPFILLTTILLTQWHVTPLKLPTFPPLGQKISTNLN